MKESNLRTPSALAVGVCQENLDQVLDIINSAPDIKFMSKIGKD